MIEAVSPDIWNALLPQLGLSLVFLGIGWFLYKDQKKTIEEKDARIKELSDSILAALNSNTEVQAGLKGTISELKESVKEGTEATRTLTQKVREVLTSNNRKE